MFLQPTSIPIALTTLFLFLRPLTATAIYYDPATAKTTYPFVMLEFPGTKDPELASMKISLVHKEQYGIIASERRTPMIFDDLFKEYKTRTGKYELPPAIIQLTGVGYLDKYMVPAEEKLVRIVDTPETAFRTYCTYFDEERPEYSNETTDHEFSARHFTTEMKLPVDSKAPEIHCTAFYINPEFGDEMKAFLGHTGEDEAEG